MVFLQPSVTESAFVFSTDDGSDAILLDVKGVYALIDGGNEPLRFMDSVRTPSAAIVSTASPSAVTNAIELNRKSDSLVAVIGNLPSPAALKDAAAAEPIRELYKTLSVAPVVAQLKGAKPEPIVIHKGLSSGTLSVYTLAGDAKDAEAVAKAYQSGSSDSIEAAAAAASSVLLIVWQPVREDAPIKRILHLGSAPLSRIQQALDRARSLPFLQSATASAASLKAKPAASAAGAARPSARSAAAPAAKPAGRVAPATRPAAPATRPTPAARAAPAAAARPASAVRASLPTRAAAPASSAARPARTSAAPAAARSAVPAARAAGRPSAAGAAREEVAKKTIVGKSAAAPSSTRGSASSTPNGSASRTPNKAAAPAAAAAAVAAVAATTVAAAAAAVSPSIIGQSQQQEEQTAPAAAPSIVATDALGVSIEEPKEEEEGFHETPGGLPVPASPTIIPATPQPPMSPEPEEEKEEPVRDSTPAAAHEEEKEEEHHAAPAAGDDSLLDVTQASAADEEEEAAAAAAAAVPSPPLTPSSPSAPLEPTASVDEPEFVKELVEEEPEPTPTPAPTPVEPEEPEEPEVVHEEEPQPVPVPAPAPVDPTPVGDLLGDFDTPVQPQQPGDDGLLDSLEEPMKKMQISMDTDKLAEELGLTGGEKGETGGEGEESLLDLTQTSSINDTDTDLDKTQITVIESAHEYDDLLSPRGDGGVTAEDMQRKLSEQAEELLLTAATTPFIAGLASTVVEAATIDGAKSTLESLISTRSVDSPTGDKLLSFRSSGFENPDEPKEVKYEESDPAIDDVLTKLAEESEMVNGGLNGGHHVDLNGHGDSVTGANGHHMVNGQGWPEGTTMHLPPPAKGASGRETKFKLAGPVHVDLVTVPHRGKQILLNDEAASLEFFSSVRSSIYILQSGGEVPVHVLDGWKKGKGQWAANVASRLIPTHHNDSIARWTHENGEELAELGLAVATPVDLTTLTYPDGQAKACTIIL